VVTLQSLANEQVQTLTLNSNAGFSATSFGATMPTNFVPGYALLTMFVNGTPSASQIISYTESAQTIANFPATGTVTQGAAPMSLTATTSDGATITYIVQSGPATVSGDLLTFTGAAGTVVLIANAPGNGTYAPFSATETITVTPAAAPATDTPTMPQWALAMLAALLLLSAAKWRPEWRR
jgi:hypothetical protein